MMKSAATSVWILGDQLLVAHPALAHVQAASAPGSIHVVIVESERRFTRHPYHKKKQVLLKSAMRHYADRLRQQGYDVDYRRAESLISGLRGHIADHRPARLVAMEASEYRGRQWQREQASSVLGVSMDLLPNTQFLVSSFNPYLQPAAGKRYVMESFYRKMRQRFRILMDGDQPVGGSWNYDKLNRASVPDDESAPRRLAFVPDALTAQVMQEIEAGGGWGSVAGFDLAVTHEQAAAALEDFIIRRLPKFGVFEDAMTARDGQLYHSLLSPYLNIGLLEPLQVIHDAEAAYAAGAAPLNSVEGLIRQILGWREFMYWQYWRQMPEMERANAWNATNPLPELFWTGATSMRCLRSVLERVQADGYAHHIERLMLLANFAMLTGLTPMAVNDWFLSAFIDAYEWVMIPNVLGMGLNADGGVTATKPYVASANYINRMSDYCKGCPFDHTRRTGEDACPFNYLYWNFLIAHEDALRANPRFGPAVLGVRRLSEAERQQITGQAAAFISSLSETS
jgi:deoxyribodipyrimidine photolyase-related protein